MRCLFINTGIPISPSPITHYSNDLNQCNILQKNDFYAIVNCNDFTFFVAMIKYYLIKLNLF